MKKFTYKNLILALMTLCIPAILLVSFNGATAQSNPDLSSFLDKLNEEYTSVNGIIPNRHDFDGGETGYSIDYGGGMFWNGNYISTNIGGSVSYSNNAINNSSYFGGQGQYFTRKFPGLFVLAANLNAVNEFTVSGAYNYYSPNLDGAVLTSGSFIGFVKRTTETWGYPSVNHLIIVRDSPGVNHTYSNDYEYYNHTISGLNNTNRIYFLLYAGSSGYYIDDEATQQIMDAFVALLVTDTIPPIPVSNFVVSNILNSSALLTFTAPYDDSLSEAVMAYDVRLSTTPLNTQNYFEAPVYEQSIAPGMPGTTDSLNLEGLTGETQYWVGICAVDKGGNLSSPVFTSFTSMPDPVIVVSISELELEVPVGEILKSSFQIANTQTGAGPLAFSINSSSQQFQETMAYVIKDGNVISKVDFNNQEIEEYYFDFSISELLYHKATGNLWLISYDYNRLVVFSPATNSVVMTKTLSSPRYIFTTNDQNKIGVIYSTYPAKIEIYNPATMEMNNSFNLPGYNEVFDATFSPDGSKLYIADYPGLIECDSESGEVLNSYDPEYYDYFQFIISDDGNYAYCASYYYSDVVKFNLATGEKTVGNSNYYDMSKLALSPDGELLYIGHYYGSQIQVMNTQTMSVVSTLNNNDYNRDLKVSRDGSLLYCLNRYSPNMLVFDLASSSIVQSYDIGGSTTRFTFGGNPASLFEVNPATGTIAAGDSQEIELTLDAETMMPGIYQGEISIESNDPANPLIIIPVTLIAKDITGPDFNMVFFQNHYLTSNLRVLMFAREDIPDDPVLSDGAEDLEVMELDSLHYMYYSDYKLTATENITFTMTGADSVGNMSTFERILSSTKALKYSEVVAQYPNNEATVSFTSDAINSDLFVTIWKDYENEEVVYHVGPDALQISEPATISLSYENDFGNVANPCHLAVFCKVAGEDSWKHLPGTINKQTKTVSAVIDQLGTFKIGYDENIFTPEEEMLPFEQSVSVAPNPFNDQTNLIFNTPVDGMITVELHDLTGNQVLPSINRYYGKGLHNLTIPGHNLKSGVYFLKIKIAGKEHINKLIRVD
jgi:hypothetical protein